MSQDTQDDQKKPKKRGKLHTMAFAPEVVTRSRVAICEKCENYTKARFCKLCKCFMPGKAKLRGTSCPDGKWGPYNRSINVEQLKEFLK
jgi:predicted nucleic acid binding AN1-type Zn finger protein